MLNGTWWINNDQCVNECPLYYAQTIKDGLITCKFCGNNCTKWCEANNPIDSLAKVQALKGCTHINGSLIIRMAGVSHNNEEVWKSHFGGERKLILKLFFLNIDIE